MCISRICRKFLKQPISYLLVACAASGLLVGCGSSGGTITTAAGNGRAGYSGDNGSAVAAELDNPRSVAVDPSGNLYIADSDNNVIREVAASGTITTVAGNGTAAYSGDNGPATSASLNSPYGVAVDSSGNLYIADFGNQAVRKVTAGVITTVAGNGTAGYSGDNGPATSATLSSPFGVALDSSGNLYIADFGNRVIREITASSGVITTVAGNGTQGFAGDNGPATSASLNGPSAVAVDSSANLYIADRGNNLIRKVTASSGVITTIAGNRTAGYTGNGGSATNAELNGPFGVAVDSSGNVYIADANNEVIRKVSSSGTIATAAGSNSVGFSGDNGPATGATLNFPTGVALNASGALYIADSGNNAIRMVTF